MFGALAQVRPQERRVAWVAFLTLMGVMAGHAVLETARDALFLARMPASRLPWVYLAVAAAALGISSLEQRAQQTDISQSLVNWLGLSAVVTGGFWVLVAESRSWVLYTLYVWSAVIATVILTRFWILLSHHFTVTQAKRVYAFIGAGSVLGAIAGSGVTGFLTAFMEARSLLLAAAGIFLVSAVGPLALRVPVNDPEEDKKKSESVKREGARSGGARRRLGVMNSWQTLGNPYVRRVGILVLVSTVTFTLVDYVFKSTIAARVDSAELGAFFARIYFVLNLLSLFTQILLVRPLIRILSVNGALIVLPSLLLFGALGLLISGGIWAAISLKGGDGSLRHSLHRTASELLFVPMKERVRVSAKTLIDVVGQRGGQAVASVLILATVALSVSSQVYGILIGVLSVLWITLALESRSHYLNLFRSTLKETAHASDSEFPELDLSSLESVIVALNSSNDSEVRAALTTLAEEGRARLIPALILYHPSTDVVLHALDILVSAGRDDFVPITDRLLTSSEPEVRAASLRARTAIAPDEELLWAQLKSDCPVVRSTALVCLASLTRSFSKEIQEQLNQVVDQGSLEAQRALARAIGYRPRPIFEGYLVSLARIADLELQRAALASMAQAPSARYLQTLLKLLVERELRAEVRATLVEMGETALSFLGGVLADEERPPALRRHLPRTIMRFKPARSAPILVEQLAVEKDGVVRYKILRALGRLVTEHPDLKLDPQILKRLTRDTVTRVYQLLEWRIVLERGATGKPARATSAHGLLVRMINDKRVNAIERLFRLLGLQYRNEDLATIFRGLNNRKADVRASSQELLESMLQSPLREAVLASVDDTPDQERFAAGQAFYTPRWLDYEDFLQELLEVSDESIRSLVVYHVGELGLQSFVPRLQALQAPNDSLLAGMVTKVIESLEGFVEPSVQTVMEEG